MGNYRLLIYIIIYNVLGCLSINTHQDIVIFDDDVVDEMNSTEYEYLNGTSNSLTIWLQQQLVICIISVVLGTLLVCVTFIVPAVVIINRIRRDRHQSNFKGLRRISDFI